MDYATSSRKAREYAVSFYTSSSRKNLMYHDLFHTEKVVSAAREIAAHYQLNERDLFVVTTAAWFHDTGYYIDPAQHEEKGAALALEFLAGIRADASIGEAVKGCIMATKMPQRPTNLLEEIVCDADLFHFGTKEFAERNKLMRKECEVLGKNMDKNTWRTNTIALLKSHHYHTEYCRKLLEKQKQENLLKLMEKERNTPAEPVTVPTSEKSSLPKSEKPSRGIETMFRVTSNNHQRLSDMADNKAHIMITTTSIIISVLLSVLLRKLEEYPHLTIPAIMLLLVCVVTMVFSILATRPNIPEGTFTKKDIEGKNVNLLFFGNFYKMSLEEYTAGMQKVMEQSDFLYGSLIRDVYSQGVVLGRKYKLLRSGYNIFMFGIIISVLAFVIAALAFGK